MNFLSHLFLSGNSEEILLGNFIADAVKGNMILQFPPGIQQGIQLHRKIDTYTDTHEVVDRSKQRLRPIYKKYSPVITDVFYDHFLANKWEVYSDRPLSDYVQEIYELVNRNHHFLPEKTAQFNFYMQQNNILEAYARLEGIEKVLYGMSRRTPFESNMEKAIHDLKKDYHLYEEEFDLFFPELIQFVNTELSISSSGG